MKKTRIISAILSVIMIMTIITTSSVSGLESQANIDQPNYSSPANDTIGDDNVCCLESPDSNAYLSNEKFFFAPNEIIKLEFIVKTDAKIIDYSINTDGVTATESAIKGANSDYAFIISFPLLQASANEYLATFSITFNLSSEETLTNIVYIFKGNDGCAISSSAHSTAKRLYYANMYNTSKITKEEYDKIVAEDYSSCVTSSSEVSETLLNKLAKRAEDKSARSDIIAGELYWKDRGGQSHPLRGVKVELYSTNNPNTVLETIYTDYDGAYIFSSYSLSANNRQVNIRVYAGDDNVDVYDYTNDNQLFCLTEGPYTTTYSAETILPTITFDMESNFGQALQIFQAAMTARDFAWNMMGGSPQAVKVYYPTQYTNCSYHPDTKKITITANYNLEETQSYLESYESWDVIMHEYGHHIQHQFGTNGSGGGEHAFGQNLSTTYGQYKGTRLAWGEAWPTVFALMAQEYFWLYVEDLCYYAPDCPEPGTPEAETHICFAENLAFDSYAFSLSLDIESCYEFMGEAGESSVMAVLWDLYDYGEEAYDEIGIGAYAFWHITTAYGAQTFTDFIEDFYNACNDPTNTTFLPEYINDIAHSLVRYNMSGKINNIIDECVLITGKGGPGNLYNTDFFVTFYDANGNLIATTPSIPRSGSTFEYVLSDEIYNVILNAPGDTYSARLTSIAQHYDSNAPEGKKTVTVGPYYSPLYTYSK